MLQALGHVDEIIVSGVIDSAKSGDAIRGHLGRSGALALWTSFVVRYVGETNASVTLRSGFICHRTCP